MNGFGVRPVTSDDVPWCRALFIKRYPNNFDADCTEAWLREIVLRGPMNFHAVRTDDALCISLITAFPWLPTEPTVNVVSIIAEYGAIWQAVAVLRASIAWARSRKATSWRCQSDVDVTDLEPLMRRLGIPPASPRFKLSL